MSKAKVEWTRELLEEILELEGAEAHRRLAERVGIKTNTVYSMRSRLYDEGVDSVLDRQQRRYLQYNRTKEDKIAALSRVYTIRGSGAGRGARTKQYTVTLPPAAAEAWLARFGPAVRWEFEEDGARLVPISETDAIIPSWLTIEADGDDDDAS